MKKLLLGMLSAAAFLPAPALSDTYTPYTPSALGCMKLKECTNGVFKVSRSDHLEVFGSLNWSNQERAEAGELVQVLSDIDVDVYIAEPQYFPRSMLAVYYTDINTIYLNGDRSSVPTSILQSLRHEAWHTAQDCMAGSVKNTFMAVIFHDGEIPEKYKRIAQMRYGRFMHTAKAVPWEQGAIYAGDTPGLSLKTLKICRKGRMWDTLEPTPLTKKWLVKKGYMD